MVNYSFFLKGGTMHSDEPFFPKAPTKIVKKCAYCKNFYAKVIDGVETKTEEDDLSCEISHGTCPKCLKEQMEKLGL